MPRSNMEISSLLHSYELLVDGAEAAFEKMTKEYGTCIRCRRHCSDCCHAVFGLFLIEAVYLKSHFDQLDGEEIRSVLFRCNDSERALSRLEVKLGKYKDDLQSQAQVLARERIPCPLLDENQDCILYLHRPITCRVYGIPTKIQGKARVCGKSGFKRGESYPAFDLDGVYVDLFDLSKEVLKALGGKDSQKASLLISVPKAITTPVDELINETFG